MRLHELKTLENGKKEILIAMDDNELTDLTNALLWLVNFTPKSEEFDEDTYRKLSANCCVLYDIVTKGMIGQDTINNMTTRQLSKEEYNTLNNYLLSCEPMKQALATNTFQEIYKKIALPHLIPATILKYMNPKEKETFDNHD